LICTNRVSWQSQLGSASIDNAKVYLFLGQRSNAQVQQGVSHFNGEFECVALEFTIKIDD